MLYLMELKIFTEIVQDVLLGKHWFCVLHYHWVIVHVGYVNKSVSFLVNSKYLKTTILVFGVTELKGDISLGLFCVYFINKYNKMLWFTVSFKSCLYVGNRLFFISEYCISLKHTFITDWLLQWDVPRRKIVRSKV